jgi:hypothetical protein
MRKGIVDLIFNISKEKNAFDILENKLVKLSLDNLKDNIIEVGILPEMFCHDSSEEKLWAKYSDIILCKALTKLGISSEVLRARGDSADVFGKTSHYSIVADAKTFRLSRTAKNQKDFKIKALDDWRKNNNFALLVSPLMQYPNKTSQIYFQAIEKNVTLLSYTHLLFLLDFLPKSELKHLWETGLRMKNNNSISKDSSFYWQNIDEAICNVTKKTLKDLREYKIIEIKKTKELGREGIIYWKNRIKAYNKLSKKEAINRLIKSEKIESKIKTIEKAINIDIVI